LNKQYFTVDTIKLHLSHAMLVMVLRVYSFFITPAAHGNSLSNRPFIRTNPSVIDKMKEVVGVTGGHAGQAKMYKESVRSISSVDPRMCPRDIKQVGSLLAAFLVI